MRRWAPDNTVARAASTTVIGSIVIPGVGDLPHALEIACASRNATVTTPLGSCVRRAVRTTSGYVQGYVPSTWPSKNATSRAAGCSAGVSAAICSGGGSGKSSGFLRVARR